ncbi:hypothetical protein FKP32DRAFT_1677381 [Trametes sanguinea]|nr:hypothetical protein FKP32DRAFT_1677381 [Trametes sanguinea]
MVAIFIITRVFAVSALFAGAFQVASAAPVGAPQSVLAYNQYGKRWCRQMGCLFEEPTSSASSGAPEPTGVQTAYDSAPPADKASAGESPNRLVSDETETVFTVGSSSTAETSAVDDSSPNDTSDVNTLDDSPVGEESA